MLRQIPLVEQANSLDIQKLFQSLVPTKNVHF